MPTKDQSPTGPYHAGPGTGHEIGIMIGFMAAFALTMIIYLIFFRRHNQRSLELDLRRREQLAARGFGGLDEKTAAHVPALYADDENDISPAVSNNNGNNHNGPAAPATTTNISGPTLGIPREVKSEKEMQQERNNAGQDGIGKRGWSLVPVMLKGKTGSKDGGAV